MKIEFQNSVKRLSCLCRLTDIKIAWINPWKQHWFHIETRTDRRTNINL